MRIGWIELMRQDRHNAYNSFESSPYKLNVPTSKGNISIPTLGGSLSLNGRDSKVCYRMSSIA